MRGKATKKYLKTDLRSLVQLGDQWVLESTQGPIENQVYYGMP